MIKHIYPDIQNPKIVKKELIMLLNKVAKKHNLPVFKLKSKTREMKVVEARREYAKRAHSITGDIEQIMSIIGKTRTTFYNYL